MSAFDKYLDYEIKDPVLAAEVEAYANGPRHERSSTVNQELVAELHEDNVRAGKQHFHFDREHELAEERPGKLLECREFLRLLNQIVPARFGGIDIRTRLIRLETLFPSDTGGEWRFTVGLQAGVMHEYSTMYFDSHGVPTSEKWRGWRTVLLRLLLAGAVKEEDVERVFGRPDGPQGRRYREMLQNFRNRKYA